MCAKTVCAVVVVGGIYTHACYNPKVKILYKSYIFNVKGLNVCRNPFSVSSVTVSCKPNCKNKPDL